MQLTQGILDLAKDLEAKYKMMIADVEDVFEVEGNPFYLKAVANELMKAAMTSLTLKSDFHMKLVGARNEFLNGTIDEDDFCMKVLMEFENDAYSAVEEDMTEILLKVYSMMKRGADLEITLFGDNAASEAMKVHSEKVYALLLTTLPQDSKFFESNFVVEDLVEDYVLEKIGYADFMESINNFYEDWVIRKANNTSIAYVY